MKIKSGFTLIEMLVVIAIIGLLAVFIAPNLLAAPDKAKEAAEKTVMQSVQLAVEAYNLENSAFPMARNIPVKSLCENYLIQGNYITSVPKNPFTGKEYTDADSSGKIVYNYSDIENKYTLTGYKKDGFTKLLELTNM